MADENEAAGTDASGAEAAAKAGIPWLLLILVAVLAIGAGAGGAFFLLSNQAPAPVADGESGEGAEGEGEDAAEKGSFAERTQTLDPFVVNVSGDGYPRYLKVQVAFEMDSAESKVVLEEHLPQVRDTTILLLSSKRLPDITDFEGKALLKDDLRERVNSLLSDGRVESVLFTEFVVQ